MIQLEEEFTYWASLKAPVDIGAAPLGQRLIVEVTGGELTGKRIRGTFGTGGADWLIVGPDGFGRLDVRAQLTTDDGANVWVHYQTGLLEMNEAVQAAMSGETGTDYGDQYFRTSPRFETGDERYAWLNQSLFLAEGRIRKGRIVEYTVYRVL